MRELHTLEGVTDQGRELISQLDDSREVMMVILWFKGEGYTFRPSLHFVDAAECEQFVNGVLHRQIVPSNDSEEPPEIQWISVHQATAGFHYWWTHAEVADEKAWKTHVVLWVRPGVTLPEYVQAIVRP